MGGGSLAAAKLHSTMEGGSLAAAKVHGKKTYGFEIAYTFFQKGSVLFAMRYICKMALMVCLILG